MSTVTVNKYDIYKALLGAFVLGGALVSVYAYNHPRIVTKTVKPQVVISKSILPTIMECDVSLTTAELKHIVHRHELADMGISVKLDY